MILGP
jgi:hypothetical protein